MPWCSIAAPRISARRCILKRLDAKFCFISLLIHFDTKCFLSVFVALITRLLPYTLILIKYDRQRDRERGRKSSYQPFAARSNVWTGFNSLIKGLHQKTRPTEVTVTNLFRHDSILKGGLQHLQQSIHIQIETFRWLQFRKINLSGIHLMMLWFYAI